MATTEQRRPSRARRLRPAGLPLRPAGPADGHGRGPPRRHGRPLHRHARPTRRPTPWSPPSPPAGPSGATRRRSGRPGSGRRRPAGCCAGWACSSTPSARGRLHRHQGAGGRPAPLAPAAHPRPGHRALPGGQLPDLRDGGDPRRVPGRARARRPPLAPRPRRHRPGRRRAGAVPVVEQPGQPGRRDRRPGGRGRLGTGARRAGPVRRVLRRVHLGRASAAASCSRRAPGSWPCTPSRSGRTWPAPGSASTPATPTSSTTCPSCASTPASWSPARRSTPPPSPSTTTTTSTPRPSATAAASSGFARILADAYGIEVAAARRRDLPLGARPGRRRLGLRRAPGRRRRAAW